jgi:hypothetical protein
MLNAHPLLAVVNVTYWLPRNYRERAGLTRQGYLTQALVPLLLHSPKFGRMGFGEEDLRRITGDGAPIRYVDFVRRLFDEYARRCGKQLAGDKTPGYVRRIAQLHELWPAAKIVLSSLRATVGLVLQDSLFFRTTRLDNIAYGPPDASRAERMTSLAHAGVHTTAVLLSELLPPATAFPHAMETVHASW